MLDFDAYLSLLDVRGAMVNVGLPEKPLSLKMFLRRHGQQELLRFQHRRHRRDPGDARLLRRARHRSEVEVIPAEKVNEAYERSSPPTALTVRHRTATLLTTVTTPDRASGGRVADAFRLVLRARGAAIPPRRAFAVPRT